MNFLVLTHGGLTSFTENEGSTAGNGIVKPIVSEDSAIKTHKGDVKIQLKKGTSFSMKINLLKIVNIYNTRKVDISKKKRDLYADKYLIKKDLVKEGIPQDLIVSGGHMVKLGNEYHLTHKFSNRKYQKESGNNNYYHIELEEYDSLSK